MPNPALHLDWSWRSGPPTARLGLRIRRIDRRLLEVGLYQVILEGELSLRAKDTVFPLGQTCLRANFQPADAGRAMPAAVLRPPSGEAPAGYAGSCVAATHGEAASTAGIEPPCNPAMPCHVLRPPLGRAPGTSLNRGECNPGARTAGPASAGKMPVAAWMGRHGVREGAVLWLYARPGLAGDEVVIAE